MRGTALLRKMIELEMLQEQVAYQLRMVKQQMRQEGLELIQRQERPLDIHVQYRWKGSLYEGIFMRPMLDAEVQGRIKNRIGRS